jgi:hypothetical protein
MKGSSRNPHPKAHIRKSHLRHRRVSYQQKTRPDPQYAPYIMHEDCSEPLDVSIWMPMYWREFLAKTQHLTCEEKGAYGQLIAHYWLRGGRCLMTTNGWPLWSGSRLGNGARYVR